MSGEPSEPPVERKQQFIRAGEPYEVWSLVSRQANSLLSMPNPGGALLANGSTGNSNCEITARQLMRNSEIWFHFFFKDVNSPTTYAMTAQNVNEPIIAQAYDESNNSQLFRLKRYRGFGMFESFTHTGSFLTVNELSATAEVILKPMKTDRYPNPQTLVLFHEL